MLQRRGPRIDKLLQYALYAFYVFYLPCIFLARERWKKIFLLTAVLVGMPPFSYAYSMVFVIIPLMLFLNENKGKPRRCFLCSLLCVLYRTDRIQPGFYFRRCNRAVCLFTECIGDVTGTHGIDRISCIRDMDYENYRGIAASKE